MIIKHHTLITERVKEVIGSTYFNSILVRNIATAKVALDSGDIKAAIMLLMENQLRQTELSYTMDSITKLLETSAVNGQPETLRDMIQESFTKPAKKVKLSEELFPDATGHKATEAFNLVKGTQPQNCDIIDHFLDKGYRVRQEYYLVKRRNGRLVFLLVSTDYARILRTGKLSRDNFTALKAKLSKG